MFTRPTPESHFPLVVVILRGFYEAQLARKLIPTYMNLKPTGLTFADDLPY
jgi:hypothetical protein